MDRPSYSENDRETDHPASDACCGASGGSRCAGANSIIRYSDMQGQHYVFERYAKGRMPRSWRRADLGTGRGRNDEDPAERYVIESAHCRHGRCASRSLWRSRWRSRWRNTVRERDRDCRPGDQACDRGPARRAGTEIHDRSDDSGRGRRRWSGLGKYQQQDLSLPDRQILRQDEDRRVHVGKRRKGQGLPPRRR